MSYPSLPRVLVGTDIVTVSEVAAALERFGARYLSRCYTDAEVATCTSAAGGWDAARLAARFAAKEAVYKVLSPETGWLNPRSVEVVRSSSGVPSLRLTAEAMDRATELGIASWSVSVSHEATFATAVVVAVAPPAGPQAHT